MLAVHAGPGKVADFGMGEWLAILNLKELHPGDAPFLVGLIRSYRHIVFCSAYDHARGTTGALVEVDNHSESVLTLFLSFHYRPRLF
jgi:hypothetical protein